MKQQILSCSQCIITVEKLKRVEEKYQNLEKVNSDLKLQIAYLLSKQSKISECSVGSPSLNQIYDKNKADRLESPANQTQSNATDALHLKGEGNC